MKMFFYICHRFYNWLRSKYCPPLSRYRKFKNESERTGNRIWKEKTYPTIDR